MDSCSYERPMKYPVTPDGRYFVVRGRLWRCSDPSLPEDERQRLVNELMDARRAVRDARQSGDPDERAGITATRELLERLRKELA